MQTVKTSNWTIGENLFGTYSTAYMELVIRSKQLAQLAHWALDQFELTKIALYSLAATEFINGKTSVYFDSEPNKSGEYEAGIEAIIEHKWLGGEAYDLSSAASFVTNGWKDFAPTDYVLVRYHNESDSQ